MKDIQVEMYSGKRYSEQRSMGPWDHGSKGPDPFLQILGKCRTCINEILKF